MPKRKRVLVDLVEIGRKGGNARSEDEGRSGMKLSTLAVSVAVLLAAVGIVFWSSRRLPASMSSHSIDARISALTDTQRNCLGMFLKYDRVPMSDLTASQFRGIQACQSLGLYHDLK